MKPELEQYLWERLPFSGDGSHGMNLERFTALLFGRFRPSGERPRSFASDVIAEMLGDGMIASPKQAWRTLEKWTDRDIYNYGTCLTSGWREPPCLDCGGYVCMTADSPHHVECIQHKHRRPVIDYQSLPRRTR